MHLYNREESGAAKNGAMHAKRKHKTYSTLQQKKKEIWYSNVKYNGELSAWRQLKRQSMAGENEVFLAENRLIIRKHEKQREGEIEENVGRRVEESKGVEKAIEVKKKYLMVIEAISAAHQQQQRHQSLARSRWRSKAARKRAAHGWRHENLGGKAQWHSGDERRR